jgi:hypothetical protein
MRQPALQPTALLDPDPKGPPGRGGRWSERMGLKTRLQSHAAPRRSMTLCQQTTSATIGAS